MAVTDLDLGRYKLGWADDEEYVFRPEKGLNADVVDQMSLVEGRAGLDDASCASAACARSSASRWRRGSR